MFADIAGFTAWSSMREPSQVFVLLETLYSQFDDIARCEERFCIIVCLIDAGPLPHTVFVLYYITGDDEYSKSKRYAMCFLWSLAYIYCACTACLAYHYHYSISCNLLQIGDCYVAACGVPNACSDHFTIMSRYANDCVRAFGKKVKELEVMLGPDTGDLALRGKPDTFA